MVIYHLIHCDIAPPPTQSPTQPKKKKSGPRIGGNKHISIIHDITPFKGSRIY